MRTSTTSDRGVGPTTSTPSTEGSQRAVPSDIEVLGRPDDIRRWSREHAANARRVGFVPTMGALHAGHLSLIDIARAHSDVVVVSIFVNRLQFDRADDFSAYPRTFDADVEACRRAGATAVYAPGHEEMYPPGFQTTVEPGALASPLEGASRPGHFRGMATVVTKLLNAVEPTVAVFGEKDAQQLAIVRRMVSDLDMAVRIIAGPTVREPNGLAMSSRNERLDPDQRRAAACLYAALISARAAVDGGQTDTSALIAAMTRSISATGGSRIEYVDIVDDATFEPISDVDNAVGTALAILAVWFGEVRLIDNLRLSGQL